MASPSPLWTGQAGLPSSTLFFGSLDVTSETESHGGEHLSGKVIIAPGTEPLIEGGAEHWGRRPLFNGRGDGPAPLP